MGLKQVVVSCRMRTPRLHIRVRRSTPYIWGLVSCIPAPDSRAFQRAVACLIMVASSPSSSLLCNCLPHNPFIDSGLSPFPGTLQILSRLGLLFGEI